MASTCASELKLNIPTLIDNLDNKVEKAYSGFPDRLYIVSKDGKVAYRGGRGPFGFKPAEMETSLRKLLQQPEKGRILDPTKSAFPRQRRP